MSSIRLSSLKVSERLADFVANSVKDEPACRHSCSGSSGNRSCGNSRKRIVCANAPDDCLTDKAAYEDTRICPWLLHKSRHARLAAKVCPRT